MCNYIWNPIDLQNKGTNTNIWYIVYPASHGFSRLEFYYILSTIRQICPLVPEPSLQTGWVVCLQTKAQQHPLESGSVRYRWHGSDHLRLACRRSTYRTFSEQWNIANEIGSVLVRRCLFETSEYLTFNTLEQWDCCGRQRSSLYCHIPIWFFIVFHPILVPCISKRSRKIVLVNVNFHHFAQPQI